MDRPLPSDQLVVFGRLLRRERRARDLSQEAFGHASRLAPKHVSEIERAKSDLRFATFLKLATGLGLSATELMTLYEELLEATDERV